MLLNQERWLVSYADFITLLFAFFVVMFASSQVDKKKMAEMAATFEAYSKGESKKKPQKTEPRPEMINAGDKPGTAAQALTMADLAPSQEKLETVLFDEISAGKVEISLQPRGLILSLKESAFFDPGQDVISPAARPTMIKVAAALKQIPGQIRLEGHTDNTPIHNRRFGSNWQLSTARSIAVLRMLTVDFQLPPDRLAVAGYAEFRPLDSNDTDRGRAKNRRVDLVILTQAAAAMAPG